MTHDSIVPVGSTPTFSFTVDLDKPVRLSVSNNDGEINVEPHDGNTITVLASLIRTRSGEPSDRAEDDFVVEEENNRISIRPNWQVGHTVSDLAHKVKTQLKDGFRADDWDFKKMRFAGDASYDLQVRVPRSLKAGSTISIRTTSGDVRINDLTTDVSVATASGDSHVKGVEGKVSAHSASGDVTLRSITGSVETNTASGDISIEGGDAWTALRSVSGDIVVRDFTLKNARITTVSGTVSVEATVSNAADYTFDSVSGDIKLETHVPDSGASLNFRSLSGDSSIDGDWTKGSGKRTWTIKGSEGGPKISVKTVSGGLKANGMIDGSLDARSEAMPTDVQEETASEEGEAADAGASSDTGADSGAKTGGGRTITVDADWEKAKGWLKDITQRVSTFVNDLDAAGDKRFEERTRAQDSATEPIDVEPRPTPEPEPFAATEPLNPPTASAPTEPFTPEAPIEPGTPPAPPAPPAPQEPVAETTAQRRLRLLEAVQRGELTVDEALAQLDDATNAD